MKWIYFFGIFLITLFIIILFILKEKKHSVEIKNIERLEKDFNEEKKRLNKIRERTKECPMKQLNTPRACYFGSSHKCRWNEDAIRCDLIE